MKKTSILLSLLICLSCGLAQAEENFPFVAEVTSNNVNVRAGQDKNFERVARLQKGDKVVVVGKNYSWYKIKLPDSAATYINVKYVKLSRNIGEVIGSRVNIRAGAGTQFTVLGQLKRGNKVLVRKRVKDWYKIQPVEGSYGWIYDEFLAYKSSNVPPPKTVQAPTRNIYKRKRQLRTERAQLEEKRKKIEVIKKASATPPKPKRASDISTVSGVVKRVADDEIFGGAKYKLVDGDQTVYYLKITGNMLDRFLDNKVRIEGRLKKVAGRSVISVTRIRLML